MLDSYNNISSVLGQLVEEVKTSKRMPSTERIIHEVTVPQTERTTVPQYDSFQRGRGFQPRGGFQRGNFNRGGPGNFNRGGYGNFNRGGFGNVNRGGFTNYNRGNFQQRGGFQPRDQSQSKSFPTEEAFPGREDFCFYHRVFGDGAWRHRDGCVYFKEFPNSNKGNWNHPSLGDVPKQGN